MFQSQFSHARSELVTIQSHESFSPKTVEVLSSSAQCRGAARCPRYFFDWRPVLAQMRTGYFPYTPATLLLFGMREAVRMLREEGLPEVFARHAHLAEGVRRATRAWELPIFAQDPAEYSNSLTTVVTRLVPRGLLTRMVGGFLKPKEA